MNLSILIKPVITEKSLELANQENTYTFQVAPTANKDQIKAAIEGLYQVEVVRVNTIIRNPHLKKTGRRRLTKSVGRIKKAMVTLKKGEVIELFDISSN